MKILKPITLITVIGISIFIYSGIFFDISRTELEQKYAVKPSSFLELSDGKIIHYRDEGEIDLPVVVFLHGFNGSLFNFERLTSLLSDEFRIVSLDLPGFGLTGAIPSKNYSNQSFMDTVTEVVDHLNIANFSIAGNSMGGGVAWRYTLSYPERVNALILLASSGILKKEERERIEDQNRQTPWVWKLMRSNLMNFALSYYTPKFFATQGLRSSVYDEDLATTELALQFHDLVLLSGSREAILSMFRDRRSSFKDSDILKLIQVPSLVIHGKEDNIIPFESSFVFQENIRDIEMKIYPNIGHLPMYEAPLNVASDIKDFLRSKL